MSREPSEKTQHRRAFLTGSLGGLLGAGCQGLAGSRSRETGPRDKAAAAEPGAPHAAAREKVMSAPTATATARMPVLFAGHGSPMNAIEDNRWSQAFRELGGQ